MKRYKPQNTQDFSETIKDLLGDSVEELIKAEIQKFIIYKIRNSTKYISYKYIKELIKDLKAI